MTTDFESECARIYHDPVIPTDERRAAWLRWVDDYAMTCMQTWVEKGEPEDDALATVEVVIADWAQLPDEWMPVGHAMTNHIDFQLSWALRHDPLEGADRLRYMNMTRTLETATEHERTMAGAYHMGVTPAQFRAIAKSVRAARGEEERSRETAKTALYRYFDPSGRLLYVGIAGDPSVRDEQHSRQSGWHKLACDRTIEWFDTRDEAHQAERFAIRSEEPLFNSTHASPETKKRAIEYLLERVPS